MAVSATGCAAVWGFEQPSDLEDAAVGDGSVTTLEASAIDASGVDANAEARAQPGTDRTPDAAVGSPEAAASGTSDAGTDATLDANGQAPDGGALPTDAAAGPEAAPTPPSCAGECVAPPPVGWQGPLAIYEGQGGPPAPPLPSCPGPAYGALAYDGYASPVAPAATCDCKCSPPSGATCPTPSLRYYADPGCNVACAPDEPLGATCAPLQTRGCGNPRVAVEAPSPVGGSCSAQATVQIPPAAWSADVRLCAPAVAPAASGCSGAQVCAPATSSPFLSGVYCVARSAPSPLACPAGYPAQHVYYEGAFDSRSCTACSCDGPAGITCTGDVSFYGSSSCRSSPSTVGVPLSCTGLRDSRAVMASPLSASGGGCAPRGGAPSGAFTPENPTTVCCTQ